MIVGDMHDAVAFCHVHLAIREPELMPRIEPADVKPFAFNADALIQGGRPLDAMFDGIDSRHNRVWRCLLGLWRRTAYKQVHRSIGPELMDDMHVLRSDFPDYVSTYFAETCCDLRDVDSRIYFPKHKQKVITG